MNLRQLINLIEAEPSVQGSAAGYAPARPAPTAADNTVDADTGAADAPASAPDPKLGIAANSPAITGKAPDNMANAGDVMRSAQGGGMDTVAKGVNPVVGQMAAGKGQPAEPAADTRGAVAMSSAPSAAPKQRPPAGDQFSQNIAAANRNAGAAAKPAAASPAPEAPATAPKNQAAMSYAGNRVSAPTQSYGAGAKPAAASSAPEAPAADTFSTEKGVFGGDINVRTDSQGRKFVANPQKQGALANLNRGAPDEVRYYSPDDVKKGVSSLADRFKSFFGGNKADTRGAQAMAATSAPKLSEENDMSELRRLSGLPLNEKAVSKQQQKFMGMVHAMQKGEKVKGASSKLKKAAKGMSKKDARDFAATKHKGLPNKVTESVMLETGSTIDHILNRFKHETKNFLAGSELDKDLYDALHDYYKESGEMPYSVSKAKNGEDPHAWVSNRLENELEVMGYQRHPKSSSHALSELARLAGLSEAGPGSKGPAPNYRDVARQRMATMATTTPSDGPQDMGDVGPGEIAPTLDLRGRNTSAPALDKTTPPAGGAAKPTQPAQSKSDWMSQDLERMRAELISASGNEPQKPKSAQPKEPNPDDLFRWPAGAGTPNGMTVREADELNQMRRIAGLQECDMSMGQQDSMNVSTNMSSDGTKSVSISAQGDKADALLQMLKMAGMRDHDDHSVGMSEPEVIMIGGDGEMLDEGSSQRLIKKLGDSDVGAKIYKDMDWNEFIVKFYKDGVALPEDTWHHTDDLEDAVGTAESEIARMSMSGEEMMEDAGGIQVHDLSSMDDGSAYDETQVSDEIHDGDVIITRNGVGVMVEAWPVIVVGNSSSFHKLKAGTSWDEFEGGKYAESAQKAMEVSGDNEMVDEAERVTQYSNTPDEEYETIDAITRQGNDLNREKRQFNPDRGRDNPMAFELEESLAAMLESIKVQEEQFSMDPLKPTAADLARREMVKKYGQHPSFDEPGPISRGFDKASNAFVSGVIDPLAGELEKGIKKVFPPKEPKVQEGEAYDAAWKKTQAERSEYEKSTGKKYYDTPNLIARHDQELSKARAADDAAKDAKRSPLGRVANTLSRGLFGQEIDEAGDPYAGIEAERPYKDPKTGKMITPPRGATMPPPDSEFPPGDKRNMMPPPVKGKK